MASVAAIVDLALRTANVPIIGVSLGDVANRATWSALFLPSATAQDRTNAQTVLSTVDVSAAAQTDVDVIGDVDQKVLRAVVIGLWECWANPLLTKIALRNRILAIYKSL